jgi:hypothetical protein
MLYAYGFERVGVVVGDLYFVNPRAATRRLLEKVRSGELGHPPAGEPESSDVVHAGWL